MSRTNKVDQDVNRFRRIVSESRSIAEVARQLGYKESGGVYRFLKFKLREFELDYSHFKGRGWAKGERRETDPSIDRVASFLEKPWNEVFCQHSNIKNSSLLRRLIQSGKRQYACESCGLSEWRGNPIRLQIHHKNGMNDDSRESNLEITCPNCHSQHHLDKALAWLLRR